MIYSLRFRFGFIFSFLFFFVCKADEGMWLPQLLQQLNESSMREKGMKMSAEDIYSVNHSSLKDAVIHFGGGCTGEVVSGDGLIFTNHHCGYGQIQSHSSVEHDYLTNGFWAKNQGEELPCPGLTCTFIIRIEDVTKQILEGITDTTSETRRNSMVDANIKKTQAAAIKGTHYNAIIKPFFYGNEYYMIVTEVFKDIRMVGAPPSSIGKFGGDTDNWMWPRHTGDFSVFRIYANADNKPADYSKDNKPFKPRHHLTISLKGYKQGDFTLLFGFPGTTYQYYTSHAIKMITEVSNPNKIDIRELKLATWAKDMKASDKVRIQYSSKHAGVSNYWKKFRGENRGINALHTVEVKQDFEKKFQEWANKTNPEKYGMILTEFERLYSKMSPLMYESDLMNEAGYGIELVVFSTNFKNLINQSKIDSVSEELLKKETERLKKAIEGFYKNYHAPTDQKMLANMLRLYAERSKGHYRAPIFEKVQKKYGNNYEAYANDVFRKSLLSDQQRLTAFLSNYQRKQYKKLEKDPAYLLMKDLADNYNTKIKDSLALLQSRANLLYRTWVAGLRDMQQDKKFWPDANSTMRVAYGSVEPYIPFDGAKYDYICHLSGVIEKMDNSNDEFVVPPKLLELYRQRDFGDYAENGDVPVAFIATNHSTGGNSGSPILDAQGRLLGINFDTNWEGTMNNYHFSSDLVRNISVDIRYVLFVIDKYAGAGYLLNEMTIEK